MSSHSSEVQYRLSADRPMVQRVPWKLVLGSIAAYLLWSWWAGRRRRAEFEDYLR